MSRGKPTEWTKGDLIGGPDEPVTERPDGRTVADLEPTALEEKIAAWWRKLPPPVTVNDMDVLAAVRELARRAEQADQRDWDPLDKQEHDALVARAEAAEADRDRLQEMDDSWHERYETALDDRDRYRKALEQIVRGSAPARIPPPWVEQIARAALDRQETT